MDRGGSLGNPPPPRVVRAPALKRGRDVTPISERVKLEKVLGLTVTSSAALDCDPLTGLVAYPAGCALVLYNTRKNKQQHILSPSKKTIACLAFSWDGKYLATGECGHQPHLRVWDVQERTQVAEFLGHKYGINCVAFSPNLKYVVSVGTHHDMVVNVWDWRNNVKVASNKVSAKVKAVSFSCSGNYFVTVGNRHVKFWYLEYSRTTKYKLEPVPLMGRSAILGDQRNNYFCGVACGKGDSVESTYAITKSGLLCEFNSRRLLDKWVELRTTCANCISVGRDCIFVGCADGVVRCFDPVSLRFLATLPRPHHLGLDIAKSTHPSALSAHPPGAKYPHTTAVTFDEINRRVTCVYNDHSLFVWDVADLKRIGKSHSYLFHSACIWGVETYPLLPDDSESLLPSGTFLTCSSDDTIRIWNLDPHATFNTRFQRNIYCSELLGVLYMDPDLAYISDVDFQGGSSDKVDTTYDGKNGVRCLRVSPDGRHLASGDRSGNIRIYNVDGLREVCKIEAHDSEVLCLEYSRENSTAPVGGDVVNNNNNVNNKTGVNNNSQGTGRLLASGSRDRFVHVFDVEREYQFQQTLDDHSSSITAVRFVQGPGSQLQMISCGADKSIIFRKAQLQGSQLTFTRKHHVVGKTTLYDMEVDGPQEYVLAACQDRNVRVYSVASGKNTRCFRGAQGEDGTLIKVVLDSTGTYLATSCTDKSLYVYEYGSGECVASMFGHSELVTGLKFTEDGRHLISVSGDGCIFMWRLPENVTQAIVSRRTGVPLPTSWQEARKSAIAVTKPLPAADKEEVESALSPPLASRADAKEDHGERSPEYKFSMGPLPMWAKRQMMEMNNNGPPNSSAANQNGQPPVPQPRGRWAQRIDAARSIFEGGDRTSSFTASVNGKGDSPVKREAGNADDDFEVCPKSLQEIEQPSLSLHKLPSGRVAQRGAGDRNRCPTDSSSAASSTRMEDGDAEDEHSDTEGSEMVFYPHSEEGSEGGDSAFQVRATTEVDLKEARRRLHRVRPDRPDRPGRDPPSLYGSVTDFASELNSDEEDSSTAAEGEPGVPRPLGGSMCVSTDNLDKLGQREKFMKSNYESLDHSGMESGLDSTLTPVAALRSSISAKYLHSRGSTPAAGLPSPAWANKTSGSKSDQEVGNQNRSKRREELTQALNQARQKLNAIGSDSELGWRSNLSTSKSIGDLHSLKDGDSFERSFSELKSRDDSIRRTSSMTDISFSSRRRLLPTFPNSPGGNGMGAEPSAGLWAQAKPQAPPAPSSPLHHSPAPVTSTPARLGVPLRPSSSSNMSRSASMGSLHFPDQYSPGSGPPAPSPLARAPSAQLLTGRGSSTLAKVRSTSALGRYPPVGQLPLLAQNSDDSSSSDVDQVEPSRARVSLSRSFASKDRSPGESSFLRSRNTPHEGPRAMVEPMVLHNGGRGAAQQDSDASRGFSGGAPQQQALPGNPLHVPLTRDLCDRVADELAKVTRYAIQIFQRVTMDMELSPADKSAMTNTLAQGVVQAQQNLRPAAPPMPAWGGSGPASVPPPLPTAPPPSLGDVGSPGSAVPAVFQRYPAAGRFVNNGAAAAALPSPADVFQQQMHPLGRKGDQMSQSSSDLNALLQQYSEQLMKMVKEQINQAKTTDKSDGQ